MSNAALYKHHYNLMKTGAQLGAHVGQILVPGLGTSIGAYMGEGSQRKKLDRALTSGVGGVSGMIAGAIPASVLAASGTVPIHTAMLLPIAMGHVGVAGGYRLISNGGGKKKRKK